MKIEPEHFWDLGDGDLKEKLGIEKFGIRKQLVKAMEEIKKRHKEDEEK